MRSDASKTWFARLGAVALPSLLMLSRRSFLATAVAGLASVPLARAAELTRHRFPPPIQELPPSRPFEHPLRIPGRAGLMADLPLEAPLRLAAAERPIALLGGSPSRLWTYEGELAGRPISNPVLRVRRGAVLDVLLENRLVEDTTIHWHGLNVDEANDGSGLHPVHRGGERRYRFRVHNEAGTYWYHAHPHYRTGMQIHRGLAGMLLVEDGTDDALRDELGLVFGVTDVPLMIQDKQLGLSNQPEYEFGEDAWIGNRLLVNYAVEPRFEAERRLYRFRLLNASNSRPLRLAWTIDGKPLAFHIIGADAGFHERPLAVREAYLAPAQRLDVLVDFSRLPARSRVKLVSLKFDPMENDGMPFIDPALEHPGAILMGEPLEIMAVDLDGRARRAPKLPRRLPAGAPPQVRDGAPDRRFRLHIANGRWLINGRNHHDDHDVPRFDVVRGAREVWELRNDTVSMPHPIHLHAFRFRVLAREGSPRQVRRLAGRRGLTPHDLGWLDTVLVWPGETVRVAVDFAQPFGGDQIYMLHCHNLEHEDQGLMLNFRVRDA